MALVVDKSSLVMERKARTDNRLQAWPSKRALYPDVNSNPPSSHSACTDKTVLDHETKSSPFLEVLHSC